MGAPDLHTLKESLAALPAAVRSVLTDHGFQAEWLLEQAALSVNGGRTNRVSGKVLPLTQGDLLDLPEPGSARYRELHALGEAALRDGRCALAVLAGGMATRMGGVIKALEPALRDLSFLDLRLNEQASLARSYGAAPPLWLMTSHSTHVGIGAALGPRLTDGSIALFPQGLSVRLDAEGGLFLGENGLPSLYAPGHGDFADCLKRSGLLTDFVENGGEYVLVTNIDNLGGGLNPLLVGLHLEGGSVVTCEVVDKVAGDRGGIPARLDGRPVILEEFRLPPDFDPETVSVFNVNTFAFDARSLLELKMPWTYFEVTKQVEARSAVQYERLINEVTFHLDTQYVRVPRSGEQARFLPVKDHDELARRQAELLTLAKSRGMLPTE